MSKKAIFRYLMISLIIIACQGEKPKSKDSILLDVPLAKVNNKFLVKLYTKSGAWLIRSAYFDCNSELISSHFKIINCKKGLAVVKDTVMIQFIPQSKGIKKFHPIRMVLENNEGNVEICDTSFSYTVE